MIVWDGFEVIGLAIGVLVSVVTVFVFAIDMIGSAIQRHMQERTARRKREEDDAAD